MFIAVTEKTSSGMVGCCFFSFSEAKWFMRNKYYLSNNASQLLLIAFQMKIGFSISVINQRFSENDIWSTLANKKFGKIGIMFKKMRTVWILFIFIIKFMNKYWTHKKLKRRQLWFFFNLHSCSNFSCNKKKHFTAYLIYSFLNIGLHQLWKRCLFTTNRIIFVNY